MTEQEKQPNLAERYVDNLRIDLQKLKETGSVDRAGFCRLTGGLLGLLATAGTTGVGISKLYQWLTAPLEGLSKEQGEAAPAGPPTIAPVTAEFELEKVEEKASPTATRETATPTPDKPAFNINNPETGIYNSEALRRWLELEPQPKLDPRIDIAIGPSRYVRGEQAIPWHVEVATRLGFQSVSIAVSPPEHQNHLGINGNIPLDELMKKPYHQYVFSHPEIKRVHITCDVGSREAANGWMFPGQSFTEEQLEATYQEYRRTCDYLLEQYGDGDSDKEIIIGGPNEVELLCKGGYSGATEDEDISPQAMANAIRYYNTIHKAVRDANAVHSGKTPLKTGMEVLQIRSEWDRNAMTGLDIAASLNVPPDEISLSAWQFAGKGQEGYLLGAAIRTIKQNVPGSRIAVSEFGIADRDRPELSRNKIGQEYFFGLMVALSEDADRVTIWGLTGFDSDKNFPNNDEIRGLGLIRPDGSLRVEVYNSLREFSEIEPIQVA